MTNACFQEEETGEITFYMKGADMVMQTIVQYNDWLEEEVSSRINLTDCGLISYWAILDLKVCTCSQRN